MTIIYDFSIEKNHRLIAERGISFEEIIVALHEGRVLDILIHPNQEKYPKQRIYVLDIMGYVYLVPFVQKDHSTVFLKTAFPSRKLTKKYFGGNDENKR